MQIYNGMTLDEYRKRIDICVVCAACFARGPIVPHNWRELPPPEWQSPNHKCPSYEHYQFRSHTGMARHMLATSVLRGEIPLDQDVVDVVTSCTNCGICNEICPTYRPMDSIAALREEAVRKGMHATPLVKIDANVAETGNMFRATERARSLHNLPTTGDDLYFAGCEAAFRQPEIATATIEVLKAGGINVAGLGDTEKCCGFISRWGGNIEQFKQRAKENIDAVQKTGAKRIIVSCAECYHCWNSDYRKVVEELPFEVVHVSQVFADLIEKGKIKPTKEINKRITYHDPCFLGRHGKVYDEPRKVLQSIPGVQFTEMERNGRWAYCCGSGGKITQATYPDFAKGTGKERLREAKEVADAVVTTCPACINHFKGVSRTENLGVEVYDLSILVAQSMDLNGE